VTWPAYLLRDRTTADGYTCEFDHEDFDRACESVLWHGAWEEQTAQVLGVLARLDVLHDGDAVLDYGCGVGRIAKAIRGAYDIDIVAADRSNQMLAHAVRYLAGVDRVRLCSDQEVTRSSRQFDVVLAVEVVHHIPYQTLLVVVHGLIRRLAPGGVLCVYGNELLDVGFRGLLGVTPVGTVLASLCRVIHHEVVPRVAGAVPDRHVYLCTRP
jgi:2-polyprenyl-3-methyl-5-hydroxy-6-metoxy-1,4-benzoquinol methylase